MELLETNNIVKRFGEFRALDGVTFGIEKGKVTVLIGPNGSGKTTLINCITGVYRPDEGTVLYKGDDVTGKAPNELRKIGIARTFQIPAPFKKLTVFENLMVSAGNQLGEDVLKVLARRIWLPQEKELTAKSLALLKSFDVEGKRNNLAYELSGGQLKLLELLRLLMEDVELCVLDEPVGSIHPVLANKIFSTVKTMSEKEGITFLIVEHRLDIAMRYADNVCALVDGKILCHGSPKSVLENEELQRTYLSLKKVPK